jgi:hypothetical protein
MRIFTITARDACGNVSDPCLVTNTWTVDTTKPTITQCPGPLSLCAPQTAPAPDISLVKATDTCGGGVTIHFAGDAASGECPTVITRTYTATDPCGNSASCTQIITLNCNPSCAISPASAQICDGSSQSFTVTPSGGTGPYVISWSGPGGFVSTNAAITVSAGGSYTASIRDAKGCATSCSATLTVAPNPACTISPASAVICSCSNQNFTVTAPAGKGPYTISWSGPGGFSSNAATISVNVAGTYTATTTGTNGCMNTCSATLGVNSQPSATISPPSAHLCAGSNQTFTVTATNGTPPYTISWSGPGGFTSNSATITVSAQGIYTATITDAKGCVTNASATLAVAALSACTPPYPFSSTNPLTSIAFNESSVLKTSRVSVVTGCVATRIQLFYNDEHAMALGVRQVNVKTSSGTTTTNYPIAPLTTNPGSVTNPAVGSTIASGDQAGVDVSGRPMFPALFITDLTLNPSNPYKGDWQYGGTGIPPHAVFGTWKGAVKTIDKTHNPPTVTVALDTDPAKNNWTLGAGSDPVPAGLANEGYGAEARWEISQLGLISGHTYRLYWMVHDGDQNGTGGDSGQACATITVP